MEKQSIIKDKIVKFVRGGVFFAAVAVSDRNDCLF